MFRKMMLLSLLMFTLGCRPYDEPEFEEIDTSETGFLIPLEGDTGAQTTFDSEAYLNQQKVAAKRVQIPHRWLKLGRMHAHGTWLDTVRLVKVDRSPVTREWTADAHTGTATTNQAIWIESQDSVGFAVGFNCTAHIIEPDTAKFLYMYRSKSLADMMDTEVRARVQSVAAQVAAKYPLDELRSRKPEMIEAVEQDVVPFFKERGITITTIGMFGGFTYQNPQIQTAIDETFVAQQLKVIASAKQQAQLKENERLQLEAEAQAAKVRTVAEAEADAISQIAKATSAAQTDPLFLELKKLEVESQRVLRWDGKYPSHITQFGEAKPNLLLQMAPRMGE